MHILILGGGGFIGKLLTRALLVDNHELSSKVKKLILFDKAFTSPKITDQRITYITGNIADKQDINILLASKPDLIFHLASIVSGEAEKNIELGFEVNLKANLQILEQCRMLDYCPQLIFASSCAVFGGDVSQPITDLTAPLPRSSYGTQKAIVELLINDYSRRGFIDGRCLRLPTIAIRPGKANAATSSFVSAIIREPLNGHSTNCPVPATSKFWIQSPATVTKNFFHAASLTEKDLGDNRIITLPGLTASIQELIDALESVAGRSYNEFITWKPDSFLQKIVLTWPPDFEIERAQQLGFVKDHSTLDIIKAYLSDEGIQL